MAEENETSFSRRWTKFLKSFSDPLLRPFLALSHHAATHPKTYIASVSILSIGLMAIGMATNFTQETSDDIWTPKGSRPIEHGKWLDDESGFPMDSRSAVLIVHRDGKNLFGDDASLSLAHESVERVFESLEHFRQTPRYDELCQFSGYQHPSTNETTCQIVGASTFFNDSASIFEAGSSLDSDILTTLSAEYYPSGGLVDRNQM